MDKRFFEILEVTHKCILNLITDNMKQYTFLSD